MGSSKLLKQCEFELSVMPIGRLQLIKLLRNIGYKISSSHSVVHYIGLT